MPSSVETYIGVVVDNNDPDRLGRIKVKVMDVYDDFETVDIPWAKPWKDLSGNSFNVPENGKVVTVVFDDDKPEYIYADNYNINLENKLKKLEEGDYLSMKSILFDHKTQIYVNDLEGLKIDHKYNNINIKNESINLNLKDNNKFINIGDEMADQQMILGNHFLDWVDKFLNALQNGLLDSSGGLVNLTPNLQKVILEFKMFKELKYLSHHVNIVDNNKIQTVQSEEREDLAQYGDEWVSTVDNNNITEQKSENFSPVAGPNAEYNKKIDENGDVVEEEKEEVPYPNETYTAYAEILDKAMRGAGTDSKRVFEIMDMIRNKDDMDKVYKAFGLRESGWSKAQNLNGWLVGDLSISEMRKLEKMFKDRKIKWNFRANPYIKP